MVPVYKLQEIGQVNPKDVGPILDVQEVPNYFIPIFTQENIDVQKLQTTHKKYRLTEIGWEDSHLLCYISEIDQITPFVLTKFIEKNLMEYRVRIKELELENENLKEQISELDPY